MYMFRVVPDDGVVVHFYVPVGPIRPRRHSVELSSHTANIDVNIRPKNRRKSHVFGPAETTGPSRSRIPTANPDFFPKRSLIVEGSSRPSPPKKKKNVLTRLVN